MTAAENLERLQSVAAALDEAVARRDKLAKRLHDLSNAAEQRRADVQLLEQPRQERRSLIARLLRLGREASAEEREQLKSLDADLARAQAGVNAAADELSAIVDVEGELQAEINGLHAEIQTLHVEIADARAAVAGDALEQQAIPEFFEALEAFRLALASVYGAESAAKRLQATATALKPENAGRLNLGLINLDPPPALRAVSIPLPALDVETRLRGAAGMQVTNLNLVVIDFLQEAQRASADMVARLSDPAFASKAAGVACTRPEGSA